MKILLTLITTLFIMNSVLFAGPPRGGVITFTQPDGTTFKGLLKGTSSFNWIESNGEIIKYSKDDKFYHIATFDTNNSLLITDRLPISSIKNAPSRLSPKQEHAVAPTTSEKLIYLYTQKHTAFSPE